VTPPLAAAAAEHTHTLTRASTHHTHRFTSTCTPRTHRLFLRTHKQPCNYSGWFDPQLAAKFGIVSIDWANHENSYRSRPYNTPDLSFPDDADLVTQAQMIKAKNNQTRVFVYRQGQGISSNFGKQAYSLVSDPLYDGYFLRTVNGTALPGDINRTDGRRMGGVFDFRNASLVDWFVNEYVGGPQCIGTVCLHPPLDRFTVDVLVVQCAPLHPPPPPGSLLTC
jgi:hypothetical protein